MRETICTVLGVVGGALAAAFGGWNAALTTLVFFLSLDYLRNTVCIGFTCNELISILENAGLMGIPLPAALKNAVDLLMQKGQGTTTKPSEKDSESSQGKGQL